jgi:hypothetical protein
MECGRKLGTYLRKRAKMKREGERRDVFERYIGEIAKACHAITGSEIAKTALRRRCSRTSRPRKRTAIADMQLDEEGRTKKPAPSKAAGASAATKAPPKLKTAHRAERDKRTADRIDTLAKGVVAAALTNTEPAFEVPTRAASNTKWDKKAGILRMGDASNTRELFNLGQARKFMQTLIHGNGIMNLIEQNKTSSLRGMFYQGLHTIAGHEGKDLRRPDRERLRP